MSYLQPYNPKWPNWFQQQHDEIMAELNGGVKLHHIGSTVIVNLAAKPCIDILAEVVDHETALTMI